MIDLTKENFDDEVTNAQNLILVDFWSPGCGPCKMMHVVLGELESLYPEVTFAQMDASKYPDVAFAFDVVSVPVLVLFKEGRMVDSIVGAVPKARVEEMLSNRS